MRAVAVVTATGAILLCAACGGNARVASDRAWRANAVQLVAQLRADVSATQIVDPTARSATQALASSSDMYALLVAYSDLSGCSAMVSTTAAPLQVARVLSRPCAVLERAAALFTRATTRTEPATLVRATREAARAQPGLVRASLALRVQARGEK